MADSLEFDNYVAHQIGLISKCIDHQMDFSSIRSVQLNAAEGRVIAVLGSVESASVMDLARQANLDKSQASRAVSSLLEKGIIRRRDSKEDLRSFEVFLAAKGKKVCDQVLAVMAQSNQHIFGSLSQKDKDTLKKLLAKIHLE